MHRPDSVTLSAQEGEALIARLAGDAPTRADCEILIQVVRWYFWLVWTVQEAKLRRKRLRALLFGKALKAPRAPEAETAAACDAPGETLTGVGAAAMPEAGAPAAVGSAAAETVPQPRGGHRPGTGRLGAAAYEGAARLECRQEELAMGQRCPVCGRGTLSELPPGSAMRIDGQALLSARRYAVQKLRCSACGEIFTAPLPQAAGSEKDSARARAVFAVSRYSLGGPFYRIER
jgi:rRNA maturation protein Nop10